MCLLPTISPHEARAQQFLSPDYRECLASPQYVLDGMAGRSRDDVLTGLAGQLWFFKRMQRPWPGKTHLESSAPCDGGLRAQVAATEALDEGVAGSDCDCLGIAVDPRCTPTRTCGPCTPARGCGVRGGRLRELARCLPGAETRSCMPRGRPERCAAPCSRSLGVRVRARITSRSRCSDLRQVRPRRLSESGSVLVDTLRNSRLRRGRRWCEAGRPGWEVILARILGSSCRRYLLLGPHHTVAS